MIRKLIIALAAVAVLGLAAYFIFGNKNTNAQGVATSASSMSAPQTSSRPGAVATPASTGTEFWSKRCEENNEYCEIFQRLTMKENNQRLIELAVGYPKDAKGAQAAIILPLGVMVTDGIALQIDDQAPAAAKYRVCGPEGCLVVMALPENFVQSMSKGTKLTVSFLEGTGKKINVEMSLQGFGAKLAEVKG